jgi:hypothetical protein
MLQEHANIAVDNESALRKRMCRMGAKKGVRRNDRSQVRESVAIKS